MALIMVVKNTFVDIEEPVDVEVGRPRSKTLPGDFGSKLQESADDDGESSLETSSDIHAMSSNSLCSLLPTTTLTGRVWDLSQDAEGCREVQEVLGSETLTDVQKEALAAELHGHVLEAAVCPFANFVLQKCIVELSPESVQFIIQEIPSEAVSSLAQSKFGCRVLQRLFERNGSGRVGRLVEAVLADLIVIAQSPFGNYVVQLLLECPGADSQQRLRLVRMIQEKVGELGAHPFGCIVLSAALAKCCIAERQTLALAMLQEPHLLQQMACSRHGHRTTLAMLGMLEGDDREKAKALLMCQGSVANNKYGRVVMASLM